MSLRAYEGFGSYHDPAQGMGAAADLSPAAQALLAKIQAGGGGVKLPPRQTMGPTYDPGVAPTTASNTMYYVVGALALATAAGYWWFEIRPKS